MIARFTSAIACGLAILTSAADARGRAERADVAGFVRYEMKANHIPGLAYAVIRNGVVVSEGIHGVGNVEWQAPLTAHSRFQLASVTKLFTGVVAMRMVADRSLDLDKRISAYLQDAPKAWAGITVRNLATHTSGIPDDFDAPPAADLEALYRKVATQPLDWKPGDRARYGFNDFAILRLIMERVSGKGFEALLDQYVVVPLGLRDTGFPDTIEQGPLRRGNALRQRVPVYAWRDGRLQTYDFLYPRVAYAAGGLTSSIYDLTRLMIAIERPGFLSRGLIDQLVTPARLTTGQPGGFGIGWVSRTHQGIPVAGHSGGPGLADVLYFPSRNTAVVVLQNEHELFPWLAGGIADFFIPPPLPNAIPDDQMAVSRRLLEALRQAETGPVDPSGWSPAARKEFLGWLNGDGAFLLRTLGRPRTMTLVETKKAEGGAIDRTYAVRFEHATMRWTATVNADGSLESLVPSST